MSGPFAAGSWLEPPANGVGLYYGGNPPSGKRAMVRSGIGLWSHGISGTPVGYSTNGTASGHRRVGWIGVCAAVGRLSVARRFQLWSLVILVVGMTGIGLWVSHQIEDNIVHRTASTTALYVDSLIAPPLQELATRDSLSSEATASLDKLFGDTPLGRRIALFRLWDLNGNVIYSTDSEVVGEHIPVDGERASAAQGKISADIGGTEGTVHLPAGIDRHDLLEIYSPVWSSSAWKVIAIAEFYYGANDVQADLTQARRESWLVVGGGVLIIYVLLAAFVQRSSDTIARQQRALGEQVGRLTDLLGQNDELHRRVRSAAARTTALNERFLRRFSAELHDGPAQDISLALLQLDHVADGVFAEGEAAATTSESAATTAATSMAIAAEPELTRVQETLQRAMQEVRAISAGLMLPQLKDLTLAEVVEHAAQAHRRRTRSEVAVLLGDLGAEASLATKIAIYRIVQEALTNAWRHAGGNHQQVCATRQEDMIQLTVMDDGPGFDPVPALGDSENHLGLLGMRERVETLGGEFQVESAPLQGTRIVVHLPVQPAGDIDG